MGGGEGKLSAAFEEAEADLTSAAVGESRVVVAEGCGGGGSSAGYDTALSVEERNEK